MWTGSVVLNRWWLRPLFHTCLVLLTVLMFNDGWLNKDYNIVHAEIKGKSPAPLDYSSDPYAVYKRFVAPDEWLVLSDHARIPVRIWRASQQKAILLALHGFNDSRDAWEDSATYFTQAGITLVSPDQRGFGQAPLRGEWAGSQRMVQDVIEEINILKARYPDVPLYVMGESMGGAVLMNLETRADAPPLAGYILLAPAVWGHRELGLVPDMLLRLSRFVAPNWKLSGRHAPVKVTASDNEQSLIRLYFDPLTLRETKVRALYGLVDLMSEAMHASSRIHFPTLVIYGGKDQLVPVSAMKKSWRMMPAWVRKDYFPNGYHLLLRDSGRKMVARDIISWIQTPDAYLPSGGDVSASVWMAVGR